MKSTIIVILFLISSKVTSQELSPTIKIQIAGNDFRELKTNPDFNDSQKIQLLGNQKAIKLLPATEETVFPIELDLRTIPNEEYFNEMSFRIPSYYEYDIEISLNPVKVDRDLLAREARLLYEKDVTLIRNSKDLFNYYQKAKVISRLRLESSETKLSRNLQIAYNYLQVVNRLARNYFLVPDPDIERPLNLLKNQIRQNESLVGRYLPNVNDVKQLLKEVESIEGVQFGNTWRYCNRINSYEKYFKLKSLYNEFLGIGTPIKRRRLLQVNNFTENNLVLDLANALNQFIRSENIPREEISFIVELLEKRLRRTNINDTRYNDIRRDLNYFKNVINSINRSQEEVN